LLLLDLDETLVHSENFAENTPYDFIVDFMDQKGGALDVNFIFWVLKNLECWNLFQTLFERISGETFRTLHFGDFYSKYLGIR
jgi:hypothetical protein